MMNCLALVCGTEVFAAVTAQNHSIASWLSMVSPSLVFSSRHVGFHSNSSISVGRKWRQCSSRSGVAMLRAKYFRKFIQTQAAKPPVPLRNAM
uniref:Putative secreted protein n=1 Tax=Anopheles marajoara TaxID=58244 RepID=A0A2M4C9K4_9DIPT